MTSAATTETYPITGIPTNARPQIDPVPLRPEINAWVSNPANADQVALFVLALDKFQKLDYEDKLSYFKVCGIHGLPRAPWDQPPNVDGGYYCAHGSILFPTWHRPYLLLFEQRIYEIMINDIIPLAKPQDQPRLLDLAKSWRFPYWDWAVVNVDVPDIVRRPFLPEVISKSLAGVFGVNVQKDPETGAIQPNNPLYSFRTPEPMGKYGIPVDNSQPYDIAKSTSRYPPRYKQGDQSAETQWTNGVQNNDDVTKALRVQQDDDSPNHPSALGGSVYRLLTPGQYKYYGDFATVTYNPPSGSSSAKADAGAPGERENLKANFRPPSSHTSLESVHNTAHHSIGGDFTLPGFGTGHMADQSIAAFDPIFWLHHCHIDRLLAIWQTLNPDLWLLDADVERSARGKMSEKALSPFHADKKRTSYTSNKVREWTQFGYTYPELQYWLPQYRDGNGKFSQEKYVADVSRQVKALYAPTTGTSTGYDYVVNVEYDRYVPRIPSRTDADVLLIKDSH
ncbi:Di-copper centre-containing protein [Sistotremastrum suecicum HHB10207 ss-3]|uniref:tyrosinase n=1 Tax=Sistotremastrum suecicum HHB10207 ss-3 TaxID=1314776 RepID=A0A166CKA0_9AGAM|nr:Di-copper centre-containing protein [Sistotremastrum suecicum HHB10207 ss-3]